MMAHGMALESRLGHNTWVRGEGVGCWVEDFGLKGFRFVGEGI